MSTETETKTREQGTYGGNLASWMSTLDDALTMAQLSVPGTHDSGTQYITSDPYHTQNFGISQQLDDGIRFLDIRLAKNSDKNPAKTAADPLQVNHGKVSCDLTFGAVLNDCTAFLQTNPDEAIFMLVNDASGSDTSETVYNGFQVYLKNAAYQNLFCLSPTSSLLPLSQLRGKIVLLRRFFAPAGADLGLNLQQQSGDFNHVGWPNNFSKTFNTTTPGGLTSLHIEDQYATHKVDDKMDAVSKALNLATGSPDDGKLYLTFNSMEYHAGHTPYDYAWSIKNAMNPALQDYLAKNTKKARFGFVMLDYYNNKLGSLNNSNVEAVVNSNF